jgi:hypothetical protein
MGQDEWTHRQPGSVTGSMVPSRAIPDESSPIRPPLPRRQPKASGHQRAADADQLITPIWLVCGSAGTGQRRLQLAEPSVATPTPPPLPSPPPDNVRYLFKQVLTQTADAEVRAADESPARRMHKGAVAGSHRRSAAAGAGSKLRRRLTWVAAALVVSTAVGTASALVAQWSVARAPGQQGRRHSTRVGGHEVVPILQTKFDWIAKR